MESERRRRFAVAMQQYTQSKDPKEIHVDRMAPETFEEHLTDLLTDMHHWHQEQYGEPGPDVYPMALMHFETEYNMENT
jgi:hypothetical protein